MAATSIEWTMLVWNPTTGCSKISQGCKNCYAEGMHRRLMHMKPEKYNRAFLDGAFPHEPSLLLPFTRKKPTTWFVNSMSDLFHKDIPDQYIAKVYAVMCLNAHHTFQVLTKRPQRRANLFESKKFWRLVAEEALQIHPHPGSYLMAQLHPYKNIWEGTSIEDQKTLEERILWLLLTPAAVRWISAEPLLDFVDLGRAYSYCLNNGLNMDKLIDWIVVGGESGHKKRPFELSWARSIRDYCKEADINFFMKQVDKVRPIPKDLLIRQYPKI